MATRIEANFFLFFIALILQGLIEREVRHKMDKEGQRALAIYPEEREAVHPTTRLIFDRVEGLSTYSVIENEEVVERFKDDLTESQKLILEYLDLSENEFWSCTSG